MAVIAGEWVQNLIWELGILSWSHSGKEKQKFVGDPLSSALAESGTGSRAARSQFGASFLYGVFESQP